MKPILLDVPEILETPRLKIRACNAGDGKASNEAVRETYSVLKLWLPWATSENPPTPEESEERSRTAYARFVSREDLSFNFFDKESGRLLGGCGIHRIDWKVPRFEIGYWIRTSAEGKGFVTEMANALTRLCFDQFKANRVEIRCDPMNARSSAVAIRLGYQLESTLRNNFRGPDGRLVDSQVFVRLNSNNLPALEVNW